MCYLRPTIYDIIGDESNDKVFIALGVNVNVMYIRTHPGVEPDTCKNLLTSLYSVCIIINTIRHSGICPICALFAKVLAPYFIMAET